MRTYMLHSPDMGDADKYFNTKHLSSQHVGAFDSPDHTHAHGHTDSRAEHSVAERGIPDGTSHFNPHLYANHVAHDELALYRVPD
ncbi:hypothetical protein CYMTET_14074 [Cymbomonas tetramitiformis]|uniref:Uncharacterized protein n=1 Tax=Cymbomonas tetramitiformis TaxID=36881 RepID=A0AAE0LAR2_9CHLO|nr:hypothetical protein CYMTET_14074 [Cymbomonas tetramitiformis]